MSGILILAGSGEYGQSMDELDSYLINKLGNPKIALIPTGAGQEPDWPKWIDRGLEHFGHIGGRPEGINLLTSQDAHNPELAEKLKDFDFYYFSGGDPGYLIDTLKGSPVWEVVRGRFEEGATLAGSSAGAMILGKKLWARVYDFVNSLQIKPWEEGLGVVEFGVIPHFDFISKELNFVQQQVFKKLLPSEISILGIDELTAYVREGDSWQKWGQGNVTWVKEVPKSP